MEKQTDRSSSDNRSENSSDNRSNHSSDNRSERESRFENEGRSFQSIGKEARGEQDGKGSQQGNRMSGMSSGFSNSGSSNFGSSNSGSSNSSSDSKDGALSNLAYNWVTFVQNKAEAVKAYEKYISDAEEANSSECAELFREACKADLQQLAQAKKHLSSMLQEATENT